MEGTDYFFRYLILLQYGQAQMQPLPIGCYRWATMDEKRQIAKELSDIENCINKHHNINGHTGYILEVDIEYPEELHDLHQDMPLAPEHIFISKDNISPMMREYYPFGRNHKAKKLIGTLHNKKKYHVHYILLKFYIQMGLKVTKIHRVLLFKQEPFMNDYISHLAALRAKSSSSFEKGCLKKLANSCYGKMIEDVRKYKDVKVCRTKGEFLRASSSPFFESFKIYSKNLVMCILRKKSVYMRSCHAIGMAILDYSKLHMYDLYYNYILPNTRLSPVNGSISVIMSDTDSFLFAFKGKKTEEFLEDIEDVMDFSNYPSNHRLHSKEVAGHLGYLKDEMEGRAKILGAVALKAKCYSIRTDVGEDVKKCKGIPKVATKKLRYNDYKKALLRARQLKARFHKITSKNHIVSTTMFDRKSLSFYDDKRFYMCKIHSLPYGHFRLKNLKQCVKC